eukprot:gene53435-73048_t
MTDIRLLGDTQARPSAPRPLVVLETDPVAADRDEMLLIEDARLRPDGAAIAPGTDPADTVQVFTINGKPSQDIVARLNERLRFRIINGCQRNVIAVKFENRTVTVMAIDGQPSEPFPARDGLLVLAPGTRIDAFIDATPALPSCNRIAVAFSGAGVASMK